MQQHLSTICSLLNSPRGGKTLSSYLFQTQMLYCFCSCRTTQVIHSGLFLDLTWYQYLGPNFSWLHMNLHLIWVNCNRRHNLSQYICQRAIFPLLLTQDIILYFAPHPHYLPPWQNWIFSLLKCPNVLKNQPRSEWQPESQPLTLEFGSCSRIWNCF